MIDFRYHLVSLVSVFLALAVGIVLGAGPLKDSIGTTLADQVQLLRDEKDGLRVQLGTANAALQHRDAFITTVAPSLLSGQLTGRSVALLVLPEVEEDVVDPMVDAITTSGGKVTSRISVTAAWTDPAKADTRAKAVSDLSAALPTGTVPASDEVDVQLANLLAGAVVSAGADQDTPSSDGSTTVLETLQAAELIEVEGNVSGLAGGSLVLAPANAVDGAVTGATPPEEALATYVSLASALDTIGGGAVVTGPASSATDGGVLSSIRGDDDAKSRVSTVDTGSTPMGLITAVLAMREQLTGGSGAYGFGSGVSDLMPALVATAPGVTASPTATKK